MLLLIGLPHPSLFSFQNIDVNMTDYSPKPPPTKLLKGHDNSSKQLVTKKASVPLFADLRASITLGEALQYGQGQGLQKLINLLSEAVEKTHKPKYSVRRVTFI